MINGKRLWQRIHALAEIGATPEGAVTRFSLTKEDREAKDAITAYMEEAGMEVHEDDIGNVIGIYAGKIVVTPPIIIGSHIDTVKDGGKFDGALGVLSGIEVVQTLHENGEQLDHPIEVIAFTDEEGSRFSYGMIGSKALTGKLETTHLHMQDEAGTSIKEALVHAGYEPENIPALTREPGSVKAYLELHIEQGKVLESKNLPVGIVSGIAGPLWMKIHLTGEAGHAGATPMTMRKDPMTAFGAMVGEIEAAARKYEGAVATIGVVEVKPGGVNIIPGEVAFTIDVRSVQIADRNKLEHDILEIIEKKSKIFDVSYKKEILQDVEPVLCADDMQSMIRDSVVDAGYEAVTLPSGAGHDAMQFKDICPVGMIFVRSKNGVSHHVAEFSSEEDCTIGATILYETLKRI